MNKSRSKKNKTKQNKKNPFRSLRRLQSGRYSFYPSWPKTWVSAVVLVLVTRWHLPGVLNFLSGNHIYEVDRQSNEMYFLQYVECDCSSLKNCTCIKKKKKGSYTDWAYRDSQGNCYFPFFLSPKHTFHEGDDFSINLIT